MKIFLGPVLKETLLCVKTVMQSESVCGLLLESQPAFHSPFSLEHVWFHWLNNCFRHFCTWAPQKAKENAVDFDGSSFSSLMEQMERSHGLWVHIKSNSSCLNGLLHREHMVHYWFADALEFNENQLLQSSMWNKIVNNNQIFNFMDVLKLIWTLPSIKCI